MEGGGCCGGGIVSQGVVGQPIYDSATLPVVSSGWPVQVGAVIDGGTVIGETVVVSTPTTGETVGDSVSPPTPVAETEVKTPSPDDSEEKKMSPKKKMAPQEDGT